jgi:hypothetical protein
MNLLILVVGDEPGVEVLFCRRDFRVRWRRECVR